MALLELVQNFTTRLIGWVTCIATLPWIALLALSFSIDLVSSSARVTSVKFQQPLGLSEWQRTRPIDRTPGKPRQVLRLTQKVRRENEPLKTAKLGLHSAPLRWANMNESPEKYLWTQSQIGGWFCPKLEVDRKKAIVAPISNRNLFLQLILAAFVCRLPMMCPTSVV